MYLEVLSENQQALLPILKQFPDYYLAGGTALALYIGHRKSIDFDLFTPGDVNSNSIKKKLTDIKIEDTLVNTIEELTVILNGVKVTFLSYPFRVTAEDTAIGVRIPQILTIAGMKAYTIGRRGKWKDYVDMYFLLKKYSVDDVCERAVEVFGTLFNEKNFREELCYFEDVDMSEEVEFIYDHPSQKEIMDFLCGKAV